MKILQLQMVNFLSFKNTTINFHNRDGITLIEGKCRGGAASSNGSGKSNVLNGIYYGLFGKLLDSSRTIEDIINRRNGDEPCVVRMTITTSEGAEPITIERSRSKSGPALSVSGLGSGTASGVQQSLERILGFSADMFVRTVMFSGEISSFCRLSDKDRKSMLENILGVEFYEKAQILSRDKIKGLTAEIQQHENNNASLSSNRDAMTLEIERLQAKIDDINQQYTAKKESLLTDISDLREEIDDIYDDLGELVILSKNEQETYEIEMARWEEDQKDVTARLYKYKEEIGILRANMQADERELASMRKDLADLLGSDGPKACPTCGQALKQNDPHIKSKIESKRNGVAELEKKVMAKKVDGNKLLEASQKARSEMETHASQLKPKLGDASAALRILESDTLEKSNNLMTSLIGDMKVLERSKGEVETLTGLMKNKQANLKASKDKMDLIEGELVKLRENVERLKFWEKAFGKQGIPSLLIESAIPFLNRKVAEFSDIMTNKELDIYFDATATKGAKEVLELRVDQFDGGEGYRNLSNGWKTRADVCALLAIRELMASKLGVKFSQLFLDEVFDGLDEEGSEKIIETIRKKYPDYSVFLISHDDTLKSSCDQVLTIIKEKGFSRI